MVSIIVPVYNVEEYLDDCVRSLVEQTYENIEIILINDGSKDRSGELCKAWAEKDRRIVYVDKHNEGQAACRNLGIQIAKGEWVTFVDSDDWIDSAMIEKLYSRIREFDADIAMCEAYTQSNSGEFSSNSLQMLDKMVVNIQEEKEYLLTVRYTVWSKLYKKSIFLENNIIQPKIKFEDFAIVPVLYACVKRIACVDEALYYYRYRENSTVREVEYAGDRIKAIEHAIMEFKERGLWNEWKDVLQQFAIKRGIILVSQIYPLLNKRFSEYCDEYGHVLKKHFDLELHQVSPRFGNCCRQGKLEKILLGERELMVFGSYNLMIVAKMIMHLNVPDYLDKHFCFSSIVSTMSKADDVFFDADITHKNSFRQKHLVQDFTKVLLNKNMCEYKDVDFLLVDFLEERYDVAEVNGKYFTLSEAFTDICNDVGIKYTCISRFDKKMDELWKENCLKFIEQIKRLGLSEKVVLVKNYLCENYGEKENEVCSFNDVENIRKINRLLKRYYEFFENNMPNAFVVDTSGENIFTDKNYRHGCYPWHMNNKAYWSLRCKILKCLGIL